ncbi:thioredoxin family protein [Alistipes sp.]|uniref:thioredoxin family protein n=1 Tax=Alistipes sp. TaxID=1872444 RepID=UPI003A89F79C
MYTEDFEKIIWRDALVCIDFLTGWDPSCRTMRKRLDRFQQQMLGRVELYHIDVDDRNLERILHRLEIVSVPTVVFFHRGEELWRETGLRSPEHLLRVLDELEKRIRIDQH